MKIKKNILIILISTFFSFIYGFSDALFISGGWKINLYTTGIHGMGDMIAKILTETGTFGLQKGTSFNGIFAAAFFGIINLLLLYFISLKKLDRKFTINSFINSIFLTLFLIFWAYMINNSNGLLNQIRQKNFFLINPNKETKFWQSFIRVFLASFLGGISIGFCIRIGSSTGGIDIIAKYLTIYKKKDISIYIAMINFSIGLFAFIFLSYYEKIFNLKSCILTIIKVPLTSFFIFLANNIFVKNKLIKN